MLYNKDLFAEAGLPELGVDDYITFDEWLKYSRAINKPADSLDERVWGSAMWLLVPTTMSFYMSDPYVLGDDGRSCKGNADTEDWIHVHEVLLTAYNEDLTTETAGALLADVEEDMFLQGKIGMTFAALGDALAARDQGINVGFVGMPMATEGWTGNAGGWNDSYYIMAASEHPDEAWEFLKWLSTKSLLYVPIGSDSLTSGGGGLFGTPCYLPLLEEDTLADQMENDPLFMDAVELMATHVERAPFAPDAWTSLDPFWEAWMRITEEGVDVSVAVSEAAGFCQDITDDLWEDFDALGK
jgi:ABC-type glycerol-3-phosphate transport system substrate-binding protein